MTEAALPAPIPLADKVRPLIAGLALTAVGVTTAALVNRAIPALSMLTAAVILGALTRNLALVPAKARAGTRWAARYLLRFGIVLLGLQLAIPEVLHLGGRALALVALVVFATFFGTQWLGKRLGVPPGQSLLVATGFSICGASAIAAMDGVTQNEERDVVTAIALVTLCGSLAIALLPLLSAPLGLSVEQFGLWTGASVHDVGQVVATAAAVPGAMATAVVVKLSRVVLLAPLVAGMSIVRRRRGEVKPGEKRPPLVPLFVLGFLALIAIRTTGLLSAGVLDGAKTVQTYALAAALFGLGTGVHFASLRRTGLRGAALGLASWALIAGVSYGGIRLLGL
jgi:uncharacterized integral membrane protein (TIGR00698 family)